MSSKLSLLEPLFLSYMLLLIALPLQLCLNLVLKLGRTPRGKVSHIFALEVLDVSMIILFILNLAHLLCILIRSMMPCSCVTPAFPKKTKFITIRMPGSSFMHIVTYRWIQKQYHVRKRKIIRDLRLILETKAPNIIGSRLGVAYA
jgi:hypothetical protein